MHAHTQKKKPRAFRVNIIILLVPKMITIKLLGNGNHPHMQRFEVTESRTVHFP